MKGRGHSRKASRTETCFVVFGSSGNLATSKLLPAVARLGRARRVPAGLRVMGVDRIPPGKVPRWLTFVRGDLRSENTYERLSKELGGARGSAEPNALFYLATVPGLFASIVEKLRKSGLAEAPSGWRRVAVEKPFGLNLEGAVELERRLDLAFPGQVLRVDHFLGKAGAVGIARFRFADGRIEKMWNSKNIDSVQIMADEDLGAERRGRFYDSVGVVRDMIQSHLLQLLCLVSMERPEPGRAGGEADARRRLLEGVTPISSRDAVWGQYRGYRSVRGVRRGSTTPTFAALKLSISNGRWRGVPFYLRSGKCLARNATEVVVVFKRGRRTGKPDLVRFEIDPTPRVTIRSAGIEKTWTDPITSHARRHEYSEVIRWALEGDQGRFVDAQFNPLSWRIFDPLLRAHEGVVPEVYVPGSWGPVASDSLLAGDGRTWFDGRTELPAIEVSRIPHGARY